MIELSGAGSQDIRFLGGVQRWRERWQVPRYVYSANFDQRLLLDLEHPASIAELGRLLGKTSPEPNAGSTVHLQEMLPDFDNLWLKDAKDRPYIAEIVVPLIRGDNRRQPLGKNKANNVGQQARVPRTYVVDRERGLPPGGEWTFLKLYAAASRHDEILTLLPATVGEFKRLGLVSRWFFIRYADPEPHLRVRLCATNNDVRDEVLVRSVAWARQLVEQGVVRDFVVATYVREIERYGGPAGMEIAEAIFDANSTAIADLLAQMFTRQITLDRLEISVLSLDLTFMQLGMDLHQRLILCKGLAGQHKMTAEFQDHRKRLRQLLTSSGAINDPSLMEQGKRVSELVGQQQSVLAQAAMDMSTLAQAGMLWSTKRGILSSLAHMHVNRLGVDAASEQYVYALWDQTLEAIEATPSFESPADPP